MKIDNTSKEPIFLALMYLVIFFIPSFIEFL
jgi:hypothetical protein